jgi:RNA polymerase sigma-70 factor (ECF subfamily)
VTSELSPQDLQTLTNGVRLIALRMLGDEDAARDAAQETMSRVLDALHAGQVRDRDKLPAFVRGVAHHVIVDVVRARSRHTTLSDELPDASQPDTLDEIVAEENHRHVEYALARLSPEDRDVLRLVFVEGLTPRQLAARLHEPAERVRKRKSRALQRLREHFFDLMRRIESGHDSPVSATKVRGRDDAYLSHRSEP